MNKHLIQTGRTTRLVEKAARLQADGHDVVVLMPTIQMAQILQRTWNLSVPVRAIPDTFDWETLKDRHHPRRVCLLDHTVVEMRLQEIDNEIMRLQQQARQLYPLTTN
jgi:hypothetical protein